jgi:hypothetical protein
MSNAVSAHIDGPADNAAAVKQSLQAAECFETPYRHWFLRGLLPTTVVEALREIDVSPPRLDGVSGKRELHNDQRSYFDRANLKKHKTMADIADAFQSQDIVNALADFFGADLDGTCLRIEYAVDTTGFWLQPHTDLGVKRLTILHYISNEPGQGDLGTDIFNADKSHAKRTPFRENFALAFVPGDATYHGFQERPIAGLRKSLIINYVTADWRDREQLCFPDAPVRC